MTVSQLIASLKRFEDSGDGGRNVQIALYTHTQRYPQLYLNINDYQSMSGFTDVNMKDGQNVRIEVHANKGISVMNRNKE